MDARHAVSSDGTRIGWTVVGRGAPLLLLHGIGSDHSRWEGFAPRLSDRFELHLVDRRGRGLSGDGDGYAIEREYDDLAAVAEAIGGGVRVLGHSYGGLIALGAAARTAAIHSVVCYEGWPTIAGRPGSSEGPGDAPERIEALLEAGDDDGAVQLFMREVAGLDEEWVQRMRTQPAWAGRVAGARTLPREMRTGWRVAMAEAELRAITASVLLLIGGANEGSLRPEAEALCALLGDGRIEVLPGQGHVAMDTAPEQLARALGP